MAGADEAIEELQEIKEFLKEPAKFQAVGARIPKGVLLYGPPGTGKTLLARAVAGEAGVPFYSISGSDFVEMFVGVGASRVRDLLDQAKQNAPAIIFVDEIDAVGRHRGAGLGGGHDEREQTLNQLLVEMDGSDPKTNVILIAATNRPDILDPALLRLAASTARSASTRPTSRAARGSSRCIRRASRSRGASTSEVLARKTPGFTGADLANVLNEAALLTARSNAQLIDNRALDEAVDRVIAGPQRRTRVMKDKEKLITAYHEGGHAPAAAAMNYTDPVTKITILPRGRARPTRWCCPRGQVLDQPQRAARPAHLRDGRPRRRDRLPRSSTGASNDIEKAKTARKMVTEYGMSANVGAVEARPVAGRSVPRPRHGPPARLLRGDRREGRRRGAHAHRAGARRGVAGAQRQLDILHKLAAELLENETLDHNQIAEIFKDVRKLPERPLCSRAIAALSDRLLIAFPTDKMPIDQGADGGVDSGQTPVEEPAADPRVAHEAATRDAHGTDPKRGCHGRCGHRAHRAQQILLMIGEDLARPGSSARRSGWPRPTPNSSAGSRSIR